MWKPVSRLRHDVARWRSLGWVTPDGERAILAEIDAGARTMPAASVFGILGAILFGFAAMSFVAANWQEMSKLARLGLLLGAMLAAYGLAGVLFERQLPAFGHAATLLAVCLFGADIMLISQMYHIDGHAPDAVLLWAVGAFAAGVLIGSNPALILALLLACLWSLWESQIMAERGALRAVSHVHWPFLPVLAVLAATFAWRNSRVGLELSAIAATVWIILLGYLLRGAPAHGVVITIGLIAFGLTVAATRSGEADVAASRPYPTGDPFETALLRTMVYAAVTVSAGAYAGQFHHATDAVPFGVWAAFLLAFAAAAIWYGLSCGNRDLVRLAYLVFSVEIVTIYFKTIGTLMGSAAFFLSAGLIMIGLAALAWRLERAVRTGAAGAR
jgi:uncharacterized membrane protein